MPKTLPLRFKFILTSYGKTDAIDYFKNYDCKYLKIKDSKDNSDNIVRILSTERCLFKIPIYFYFKIIAFILIIDSFL
jgi:hypothetical protein